MECQIRDYSLYLSIKSNAKKIPQKNERALKHTFLLALRKIQLVIHENRILILIKKTNAIG